jgi:hypothetical protein
LPAGGLTTPTQKEKRTDEITNGKKCGGLVADRADGEVIAGCAVMTVNEKNAATTAWRSRPARGGVKRNIDHVLTVSLATTGFIRSAQSPLRLPC